MCPINQLGNIQDHYKLVFSFWSNARINFSHSNLWRLFRAEPGLVDVDVFTSILRRERRVARMPLVNWCVVLGKYKRETFADSTKQDFREQDFREWMTTK